MIWDLGIEDLLRPAEDFSQLHAETVRRFGVKAIDLSYPNPRCCWDDRARQLLRELTCEASLHDLQYTPFGGLTHARRNVAGALSRQLGLQFGFRDIVLTPGATAALNVALRVLFRRSDIVMLIAPFWMDYPIYIRNLGLSYVVVRSSPNKNLDISAIEKAWTPTVRGVIISQPACPTGVLYTENELRTLGSLLYTVGSRYGRKPILISDEVHRDLVWSGARFTSPASVYPQCLSVYSFGKAWAMQGQRLGYIALSPRMDQREAVARSLERAMRVTGYCAPTTLMQQLASRLAGLVPDTGDLAAMQRSTRARLAAVGYRVIPGEATPFIYVEAPGGNEVGQVSRAAERGVLVMPSSIFHEPGYFRIALNVGKQELNRAVDRLGSAHSGD